ncbi:MFS transporter [Brevibacillus ginsengisoli]|uniref:MFS transporter n=1 Tax=Brevibacillus ginsengisoli TaxID=363854 RepID=UPI003CEA7FFC
MKPITNWVTTVRNYHISTKYILLWNILFCTGFGSYMVLYNLYLKEVVEPQVIGQVVGISYLFYALFSPLAGLLADRIGSRKSLLIGLFLLSCGFIGGVFAERSVFLSLWAVLLGVGQSFTIVMFVPILTEYSKPEERLHLFSFAYGLGTFATFLGTFGSGIIADQIARWWQVPSLISIRCVILIAACFLLISTLPLFAMQNKRRMVKKEMSQSLEATNGNPSRQSTQAMKQYGITKFLEGLGVGLVIPFMNLFLANRFGLDTTMISGVLALATLGTVVMMLCNPRITQKTGEFKTLLLYLMIGLPCLLVIGTSTNLLFAALGFLLFRSMFYAMMPIQSKIIMEQVEETKKGLTSSIGFTTTTIGTGIASPLSMYVVTHYGFYWGYLILFLLSAIFIASSVGYFYHRFMKKEKLPSSLPMTSLAK